VHQLLVRWDLTSMIANFGTSSRLVSCQFNLRTLALIESLCDCVNSRWGWGVLW